VADRLSRLIELAYDAAVDRQGWRGLLEGLAAATDSDAASFNLQDLSSHEASVSCQVGADERAGRSYEQYYAAKNVFLRAAPELHRTGMVVNGEALVPDRDLLKTEYFNDFLRPLGLQHMVGVVPFREHTVIALLSLARRIGASSYSDRHLEEIRRLMPHLQRAVTIHRRLVGVDLERAAAATVLERLPMGVLLLDRSGGVVFMNRSAEAIVAQRDGLALGRGGLIATHPAEARTLGRLVAGAAATGAGAGADAGGTLAVTRPSGRRSYTVLVAPLRLKTFALAPELPAAVVFVSDADRVVDGMETFLRRFYGLTAAEARVGQRLLAGRSMEEINEELAITRNTFRTHVKRILSKTGARGRSDLVRIVLNSPGNLRSVG